MRHKFSILKSEFSILLLFVFCFDFSICMAQVDPSQSTSGNKTDSTQQVTHEWVDNPLPAENDSVQEQQPTYGYIIRARSYGDSIVLRWAVDNSAAWLTGNKYGWRVMRSGGETSDTAQGFVEVSDHNKPIKPMTLADMMKRFPKSNKIAGLAAQALYGRNFNPQGLSVAQAQDQNAMSGAVFRQYQEQTQRQIFAYMAAETDGQIAEALGMRFVDRNVKRGEYYTYYLEPVHQSKLYTIGLSTVSLECQPFERSRDELMPEIDIVQTNQRECIVRWKKNDLSGYYVERSLDGGKSWKDLSRGVPTWAASPNNEIRQVYGDSIAAWMEDMVLFIDTLPDDSKALWRIRGFDAFGELTPWQTSEEFVLQDVTPPAAPVFTYIAPIDNKYCQIEWKMEQEAPDLKGFFISFSEDISGSWEVITTHPLRPTTMKYIDSLAGQRGRGYYRVFATDSAGNSSFSAAAINHIEDVVPPAKPKGLRAVADTAGRVFISWQANTEKDLQGYKLLSANDINHDFLPVFSVYTLDNFYIDSIDIRSLTKNIYYTLYATDKNNNVSNYSDTITVELPDIVPPVAPIVDRFSQGSDSVLIFWTTSPSEDVDRYCIYRKPRGSVRWELIRTIQAVDVAGKELIRFVDRPAPSDRPYSYCIEALDSANLSSGRSGELSVHITGSMVVPMDIKLSAKKVKKSDDIQLSWKYDYKGKQEPRGLIWRRIGDGQWEVVADFTDQQSAWVDRTVPDSKSKIQYYIVVELGNGRFSTPSNVVEIK